MRRRISRVYPVQTHTLDFPTTLVCIAFPFVSHDIDVSLIEFETGKEYE